MLSLLSRLSASHAPPRWLGAVFSQRCRRPARSVHSIVRYSVPKELPPYMHMPTACEQCAAKSKPVLRMILFGKPCSGKGTLAVRLSKKYDITTVSTGDLLRQHIAQRTDIGRQAKGIVASGGLLPDKMMLDLITTKLDTLRENNWILDGFPRTQRQGRLLDDFLGKHGIPLNLVVNVDVSDDLLFQWISERRVHVPSGRVYSTSYNPPNVPGLDDVTGEPLVKRPDDNPETFARRLEHYYAQTSPLLYYYASRAYSTRLLNLYGDSEAVWPSLDTIIHESFPMVHERVVPGPRTRLGQPHVHLAMPTSLAIADGLRTL